MMETRNATYNAFGGIDCEVNHPQFGWIPFTASTDDVEHFGCELYSQIKSSAATYVAPPPPPAPTQAEQETKRQIAYTAEADPLFFKWQAGEATEAEWRAKREEIRARFL